MTSAQSKFIEKLYLEMFDMLMAYARASLENEALAEEAVQETFRIACLKPDDLMTCPNPKGWIINTLKYTIQNSRRSRDKAVILLTEYMASHNDDAFSEDHVSLDVTYGNIAQTDEFQLIKELALEGRSHLEMAQKRGISVAACKKRVQRAKEFLKKRI